MQSFQCKLLSNVLFFYKKLHTFGIKPSLLHSFCNLYNETPFHIFYECDCVECLWLDLVQCFENSIILPTLTPQTAIFGIDSTGNDFINKAFINHILLIFKLYVYKSREKHL